MLNIDPRTVTVLLCVLAVQQGQAEERPHVLFLLTDDQRPDTIHALGNPLIKTPNLDRLVRVGTTFTRATCAYPLCFPSRSEILTGCTGFRNGVFLSNRDANLELPTWPGVMRDSGYETWWVGKWHLAGRPSTRGYSESLGLFASGRRPLEPQFDSRGREVTGYRGWMFQSDDRQLQPERGVGLTPDISRVFADEAIRFLKRPHEKPFFLHVNFTAPHDPLLDPPGWEQAYDWQSLPLPPNFLPEHPFDHGNFNGRDEQLLPWPRREEDIQKDLATYYAVISHLDAQVGRILGTLDEQGLAEKTLVIFSSDHGLALGSHGLMGKQNMYEHSINVPLIFRGPGVPVGVSRAAQCYLRDLFPTVCELTGIEVPESVTGRSLVPALLGQMDELRPFIVGYFQNYQRMIRTDRWKLIRYPEIDRTQLFDLQTDPFERHDLSGERNHTHTRNRLNAQLDAWLRAQGDPLMEP